MLVYQDRVGYYADTDSDFTDSDDDLVLETKQQRKRRLAEARAVQLIQKRARRKRAVSAQHVAALQRVLNFIKSEYLYLELYDQVQNKDLGKAQLRRLLLLLTQLDTLPRVMTAEQRNRLHVLIRKVRKQVPHWNEWSLEDDVLQSGWHGWTSDRELLDTLQSEKASGDDWWVRQQLFNNLDTTRRNQATITSLEGNNSKLADQLAAEEAERVADRADFAESMAKQADIVKGYRKEAGAALQAGWLQHGSNRVEIGDACDPYLGPFCPKKSSCYAKKCITAADKATAKAAAVVQSAWRKTQAGKKPTD